MVSSWSNCQQIPPPQFDGKRSVDQIHSGRSEEVIAIPDCLEANAYLCPWRRGTVLGLVTLSVTNASWMRWRCRIGNLLAEQSDVPLVKSGVRWPAVAPAGTGTTAHLTFSKRQRTGKRRSRNDVLQLHQGQPFVTSKKRCWLFVRSVSLCGYVFRFIR